MASTNTETLTRISVFGGSSDRSRLQFVTLDGVRVGIRVRWSAYSSVLLLWLHDAAGVQIFGPRFLVPGLDMLDGSKHDLRVPQGQLFVYSPTREAPTLETIDVSAVLFYRGST
jgi:hypothetical protein